MTSLKSRTYFFSHNTVRVLSRWYHNLSYQFSSAGDMLKKGLISIVITLPVLFALFCSRFDDTTSLGKDIISNTIGPSLVDLQQNFNQLSIDTSIVSKQLSIPGKNDVNFGVHSGRLCAGSKAGITASGYFEFSIGGKTIYNRFNDTDSLISISLVIDTIGTVSTLTNSSKITLYRSTESAKYSRSEVTAGTAIDTISFDSKRFVTTLDTSDANSIFTALRSAYKECIDACSNKACTTSCDTSSEAREFFRYTLFNQDSSSLIRFKNPFLKIKYRRINVKNDGKTRDTIFVTDSLIRATYVNYLAKDAISDSLQALPLSSFASGRTAVFQINLTPLWNKMDSTGLNEILSAAFTIDSSVYRNLELSNSDFSFAVRYFLGNSLLDNGFTLNTQLNKVPQTSITAKYDSTSNMNFTGKLIFPADRFLQELNQTRPATGYLYLQLVSQNNNMQWEEVLWNKPNLKAVFTTITR